MQGENGGKADESEISWTVTCDGHRSHPHSSRVAWGLDDMWGFGRCDAQKFFTMQIRASERWCCRIFEHFIGVHDIYPKLENIPVQNILFPIAEQALKFVNFFSWISVWSLLTAYIHLDALVVIGKAQWSVDGVDHRMLSLVSTFPRRSSTIKLGGRIAPSNVLCIYTLWFPYSPAWFQHVNNSSGHPIRSSIHWSPHFTSNVHGPLRMEPFPPWSTKPSASWSRRALGEITPLQSELQSLKDETAAFNVEWIRSWGRRWNKSPHWLGVEHQWVQTKPA